MHSINLHFRFPKFYEPQTKTIQLHKNGFFIGASIWQNNTMQLVKGSNIFYEIRFKLHPDQFLYVEEAEVVDDSLFQLYFEAHGDKDVANEFHKEVMANCLKEMYPEAEQDEFLNMSIQGLLNNLDFYTQPIYYPFKNTRAIEERSDYNKYPELIIASATMEFRQTGGGDFQYIMSHNKNRFKKNMDFQLVKFFYDYVIKPGKIQEKVYEKLGSKINPNNPYELRARFFAEAFFSEDKSIASEISKHINFDPYKPLSFLDYIMVLLMADVKINHESDFAGAAALLKNISFFGGNELILYYQLLGCMMARQGFLYEAEQYKLKAVGLKSKFPLVFHQLGRIAKKQGKLKEAENYFYEALKLERLIADRQNTNYKVSEANYLEYLLCLHGKYEFHYEWRQYQYDFNNVTIDNQVDSITKRLEELYQTQTKESICPLVKDMCTAAE